MGSSKGKSEALTREEIDSKLAAAGWVIQDKGQLNLITFSGLIEHSERYASS